MSQLYVPDKAYLVCSDGMNPQQLKVSSQSSIKIAKGRLAATIKDRTGANFVCAKMVIAGAIIGVIVAAIIAAAIVLSGGTLAIGLGAMLAAGAVGGAAVGLNTAMMPCICAILTMSKDWTPVHPRVTFEDKKALIDKSIVPCFLGGTVQIMYSKEAADALASLNRSKTIAGVAAITSIAFIAGGIASAVGSAFMAVKGTFVTYGAVSGFVHVLGVTSVGGASYGLNAGYDWSKKKIKIGGSSVDDYITGEAYKGSDPDHKKLDDVVDLATNKKVGAPTDALGSAEDIAKSQTTNLNTTTQTTQTLGTNRVFVANSEGAVLPPGTVTASQTTVTSSNAIPGASPARPNGTTISSSQSSVSMRSTPNTLEISRMNTTTEFSTQFNNRSILKGSFKAFTGKYGFGIMKGMGTNMLLDAIRAGGNWLIADDLKGLQDALNNAETAARQSITVIEDEI
ncbi:PAAR-like protein [Pedobacter sp.]|jgi:hypothetical protein|uniref:PAAR-like protein n=1 Tax=Pedobacter sp. TaxID=1411316 RepID=UPI002C20B279|nr:PAAR-like protein [Pedobacter sp.]HWW38695.1 PAAR-like protein [Pedobacter sp.]